MVHRLGTTPAQGVTLSIDRSRRCGATARALLALLLAAAAAACSDATGLDPPSNPPAAEWRYLGGGLARTYFNASETGITKETAPHLVTKWRFLTGGIITAQPIVATVNLPDAGATSVVYVPSWDGRLYALRADDGSLVWSFAFKPHPGASYPAAGSAAVEDIDGRRLIYIAGGMTMHGLDAATGKKVWEFDAGTGCTTCDSSVERNEILSSPAVHDGLVYFGMDVNDGFGKGGFYAVDARTGALRWFFDLASGSACRPDAADDVRRFDGYHTAEELGLPADFFATRAGCNFERTPNTCGNVWSSAAIDPERGLLFTASSNCDTDTDPDTALPSPIMPPYDEAVFALHTDTGEPAWVWQPRQVDAEDLAFGAVPNLFQIEFAGEVRQVVGVGNKDGNYYVFDRDGVNQITGRVEPYWARQVVAGGAIGGVIASAAVGEGKVMFSTAVGLDLDDPQLPAAWGLDAASGEIVWGSSDGGPSYSPTSAVPGVVFMGSLGGILYGYDSDSGASLVRLNARGPLGSAPSVVAGSLYVGAGTGERGGNPTRISYVVSLVPSPVNAFCVAGVDGCPESESCDDGSACTIDTPSSNGCASRPAESGTACAIGDLSGQCDAGKCILQGLVCPVVSQCTNPVSVGDSCRYEAKLDGTTCESRSGAGQCLAGNCVAR